MDWEYSVLGPMLDPLWNHTSKWHYVLLDKKFKNQDFKIYNINFNIYIFHNWMHCFKLEKVAGSATYKQS